MTSVLEVSKYNPDQPRDYHGRWIASGESFQNKGRDAVISLNKYMDGGAGGGTVFHHEGSGRVFDLYSDSDRREMHEFLPKEELYIVGKTNNTDVPSATNTSGELDKIKDTYRNNPNYRGSSTGAWKSDNGTKYIDHGVVFGGLSEDDARIQGSTWDQQAVTYIDNRGPVLHAAFITVTTGEEQKVASFVKWLVNNGWYDDFFQKGWITERGRHFYIPEAGDYRAPHGEALYLEKPEISSDGKAWRGNIQIGEPSARGAGDYGFEKTGTGQKDMYLSWFGLHDAYQGQGYGRTSYGKLEDTLRKRGVGTVYLLPADDEAKQFWTHMGYKESSKNMGDIYPGVYKPEVYAHLAPLMEKDISVVPKKEEEDEISEPNLSNFVVPREHLEAEKYYGITLEKGIWDFLSHLFQRGDATATSTTYGIAADDVMSDQEYVVWQTAEDEKVCDYCGPLDFKVVSTEEMGDMGYPPVHVNCRCEVVPYSEIYGDESPTYYHSPKFEYDPNGSDLLRTERINLSLIPYFKKSYNPDQARDEHGRWTSTGAVGIQKPNVKFKNQTSFGGNLTRMRLGDMREWELSGNEYDKDSIQYHQGLVSRGESLVPPVVEKTEMDDTGTKFRVVDGRHRITAIRQLGLDDNDMITVEVT